MPLGWRLMGLVRQPDSDDWQARPPRRSMAGLHMVAAASPSGLNAASRTSCNASAGR